MQQIFSTFFAYLIIELPVWCTKSADINYFSGLLRVMFGLKNLFRPMKKTILYFIIIAFLPSHLLAQEISAQEYRAYEKLERVLRLVSSNYMDTVELNRIIENTIVSVLEELDPHSSYLDPIAAADAQSSLNGGFSGVGITYRVIKDTITVLSLTDNGPAMKAGVRQGDQLIYIDTVKVANVKVTPKKIRELLRGKSGSSVQLRLRRFGSDSLVVAPIERAYIPTPAVVVAQLLDDNVGYIKLQKFSSQAHKEFVGALRTLKKQGMKSLVLDLRNNSGGYLRQAVDISDEFLPKDKLIVYTAGANSDSMVYKSTRQGVWKKGRVLVLINKYSASASEIVAGAIQDHDRGLILGERSYGKGLVQRPFSLFDGSYVRLSVARYYTPSGRCIQKQYQHNNAEYRARVDIRSLESEMLLKDSLMALSEHQFRTLNYNRPVFEAGGIFPDVYVRKFEDYLSAYHKSLYSSGVLMDACVSYLFYNRNRLLAKYPNYETFNKNFTVLPEVYAYIAAYEQEKNYSQPKLPTEKLAIDGYIRSVFVYGLYSYQWYLQEFINHSWEIADSRQYFVTTDNYENILVGKLPE